MHYDDVSFFIVSAHAMTLYLYPKLARERERKRCYIQFHFRWHLFEAIANFLSFFCQLCQIVFNMQKL
jgi:predicted  nucleic acid-binding Zn ribbon protein